MDLGLLSQYVNAGLVAVIIIMVEFLKIYIPDNIEAKIIPIADIAIGMLLAVFIFKLNILVGFASGMSAAVTYKLAMKSLDKIGGNETKNP